MAFVSGPEVAAIAGHLRPGDDDGLTSPLTLTEPTWRAARCEMEDRANARPSSGPAEKVTRQRTSITGVPEKRAGVHIYT
ncbi:hypothetical protein EVAR_95842_1 [Eumeta japonica]|uniref:Uncharacterized protein n=1 Tax=Eumeta variegata TaxID=151549 RepID=A0A4C1VLF0_EUMVA|nr:hypothetical protein EVAR_95842_1 [Eumeta japonica]